VLAPRPGVGRPRPDAADDAALVDPDEPLRLLGVQRPHGQPPGLKDEGMLGLAVGNGEPVLDQRPVAQGMHQGQAREPEPAPRSIVRACSAR
jgi:hypothetical protein